MKVIGAKPNPNKPETGFVKFDDGREAWTPAIEQVKALLDQELPADWLMREGDRGWQLLPPKPDKGKKPYTPKWADTEVGFYTADERIDRRRAAELATYEGQFSLTAAETIYTFLRASAGARPTAQQNPAPDAEGHPGAGSTSPVEKTGEKTGVSGTAGGNTSGPDEALAYGEGASGSEGPATVGGGADRPGGTASPSVKRSADAPPPGWEGMWES